MTRLTLDELKAFLSRSVGEDDSIDLSGDILDAELAELGIDSLAILDTTARIEQQYGIKVPEGEFGTARDLLTAVNEQVGRS